MKALNLKTMLLVFERLRAKKGIEIKFNGEDFNSVVGMHSTEAFLELLKEEIKKIEAASSLVTELKVAFCNAYRDEFERDYPGWGVKENSQCKTWLKSVPFEKAKELCVLYMRWNDPWVTERGHTFGILVTKYVELDAWARGGQRLIEKIAMGRAHRSVDLKRAVEREERSRGLQHRSEELRSLEEGEGSLNSSEVHRKLQGASERPVRGIAYSPFDELIFDDGSADPHGSGDTDA